MVERIQLVLRKPDLAGWMVAWAVKLFEFGLCYELRGSIKEKHLAEFVVELPHIAANPK